MVFASSCSKPGQCKLPHPDTRICPYQFLYRDLIPASFMLVPRNCTSVFEPIVAFRFKSVLPSGLYRDYASSEKNCTMTAKTTPLFAPFRLRKIVMKTCNPADAFRFDSQAFTNANRRAVRHNSS